MIDGLMDVGGLRRSALVFLKYGYHDDLYTCMDIASTSKNSQLIYWLDINKSM